MSIYPDNLAQVQVVINQLPIFCFTNVHLRRHIRPYLGAPSEVMSQHIAWTVSLGCFRVLKMSDLRN